MTVLGLILSLLILDQNLLALLSLDRERVLFVVSAKEIKNQTKEMYAKP